MCIRNLLIWKMISVLNGNWFEYIVLVCILLRVFYCVKIVIVVKIKLNRKLNVKIVWNMVIMCVIVKMINDVKCVRKFVVSLV